MRWFGLVAPWLSLVMEESSLASVVPVQLVFGNFLFVSWAPPACLALQIVHCADLFDCARHYP